MWLLAQHRKHWACYDSQTCNHNSAINAHVLVAEWLYFDLWPTGELEEEMENPEMVDLPEKQKHQLRHRELFLSRQLESLPATHIRWNRLCVRAHHHGRFSINIGWNNLTICHVCGLELSASEWNTPRMAVSSTIMRLKHIIILWPVKSCTRNPQV